MNSVVAAQFWAHQNAYRAHLRVISKKRFMKRCCISVSVLHDLVVAVINPSKGHSTGGPWSDIKTKEITL